MSQDDNDLRFDIGKPFSINRWIISSKNLLYKGHVAQSQAHDGRWYRVEIKNFEFKDNEIYYWVHFFGCGPENIHLVKKSNLREDVQFEGKPAWATHGVPVDIVCPICYKIFENCAERDEHKFYAHGLESDADDKSE